MFFHFHSLGILLVPLVRPSMYVNMCVCMWARTFLFSLTIFHFTLVVCCSSFMPNPSEYYVCILLYFIIFFFFFCSSCLSIWWQLTTKVFIFSWSSKSHLVKAQLPFYRCLCAPLFLFIHELPLPLHSVDHAIILIQMWIWYFWFRLFRWQICLWTRCRVYAFIVNEQMPNDYNCNCR